MQKQDMPIGIFDSGVGGVSVLRELISIMPGENYIYLGDSKNAPYGTKKHYEIANYAKKCADYLVKRGVKALVIACNTATSVCIDEIRSCYPDMPVVGIEPALKPAVLLKPDSTIAVMATPLTLSESKFSRLCREYSSMARIIPLPCPGLMELVEAELFDTPEADEYLKTLFSSVPKPDSVVLGCTHYPFAKRAIMRVVPDVCIFDGGKGTANQVKRLLNNKLLLNTKSQSGNVTFENTLSDKNINALARKLLECKI